MTVRPISPKEALDQRFVPDEVIEAFNELIMEKITLSGVAVFNQDDVIERTRSIMRKGSIPVVNRYIYFKKNWLDVENIYENNGWDVTYVKPAYNESYPARFTFRPSNKHTK